MLLKRVLLTRMLLTKEQAIELFGSQAKLAAALEISRQAVSQWPHDLDRARTDRVLGAAIRQGLSYRLPADEAA